MSDNGRMAVRLHGRVQGVGFRWWCARTAKGLGVSGDVRNCPDGTVEVRAEGESEALLRFRDRLSDGPPMARVDKVEDIDLGLVADARIPVERFEIVR
ncbi:MAG TPA: acylphosphatase [Longimicrobiales bacterium]|nr:acylphosphatase [Longimicrobiales bacterium]